MALPNYLDASRGSLRTVRLRLDAEPLDSLAPDLVERLARTMTNSPSRGDAADDGTDTGSRFRDMLEDYARGHLDPFGHWVVSAWPEPRYDRQVPVAWSLLEPEWSFEDNDSPLRIGFYTDPTWRRRGLGKLLLNEILRLAHRLGTRRLIAHPWNKRSTAFFSGLGFDIVFNYQKDIGGLAEMLVPNVIPVRLPWLCRAPDKE